PGGGWPARWDPPAIEAAAARSNAVLNDPLRKLPESPMRFAMRRPPSGSAGMALRVSHYDRVMGSPPAPLPVVRLKIERRASPPWVFHKMVEKPATRIPNWAVGDVV